MSVSPAPVRSTFVARTPGRLSVGVVFAVAVVGAVLGSTFQFLWHPPFTTDFYDYDAMAPIADTWYVMHFFVGGLGHLLTYTAVAVLMVVLCLRGRVAQPLALTGALLMFVGVSLFALGLAGEGAAWRWVTDSAVLDAAAGADALRGMAEVDLTTWVILTGVLVLRIGGVLALTGVLLTRRVPRWLPITGIALVVVGLFPILPPEWGVVDRILGLAVVVVQLAVVAFALRSPRGTVAALAERA